MGVAGPVLRIRGREIRIESTLIMGVVNASPESFSDGGHDTTAPALVRLAGDLVAAGADIIDIGGQSAVTNQPEITPAEEIDRVLPVVETVAAAHPEVLISVDTYRPAVADACLAAGAALVNDVSGLAYPELVEVCRGHRGGLVVMHTKASPKQRLQRRDLYQDIAAEVITFLGDRMRTAIAGGLDEQAIILDPGPDFTKTPHQTVQLLRRLDDIRMLGRPVLLALSRKDFLGAILQKPPRDRDAATLAAIAYLTGAAPGNIVRVHDVAAARDAIRTVDVLTGRHGLDPDYVLPDSLRYQPHTTE